MLMCISKCVWGGLALDDDGFQVFAGYDERILARGVEPFEQVDDVALERGPLGRVERCEGLERRSVELTEHLDPVRARAIAKIELLTHAADVGGLCSEERDQMGLGS